MGEWSCSSIHLPHPDLGMCSMRTGWRNSHITDECGQLMQWIKLKQAMKFRSGNHWDGIQLQRLFLLEEARPNRLLLKEKSGIEEKRMTCIRWETVYFDDFPYFFPLVSHHHHPFRRRKCTWNRETRCWLIEGIPFSITVLKSAFYESKFKCCVT